ncbi:MULTISPECIES: nuclear transport factor 2 family protein [Ruegeria]|uniref:Nuclear transport factor 2 family protein n=1 Tax=Ruegeria atlantica TaxID=81569 RepID=A0ABX1W8H3_9RHOB|nr:MULTISPECIES: nuclear transport factor 2 family protein [Ruegeria]NOD29583.1 nuclear transport factor 2 family protein [Ruegeria atlantica]
MQELMRTIENYGAAWQEESAEKRLALLTQCFAENGRYVDPTADVSGREQLSAHIGEVLLTSNGRVQITSSPVSHHDVVHFTWHMVAPDGAIMVAGHDFIRLDEDGKIAHLAGFFGDPPPLS